MHRSDEGRFLGANSHLLLLVLQKICFVLSDLSQSVSHFPSPLQRTGQLKDIATSKKIQEITKGNTPQLILSGDKLKGRAAAKFYVHMSGHHRSPWTGGRIPARPFVPRKESDLLKRDKETIKQIFQKHMYNITKPRRMWE